MNNQLFMTRRFYCVYVSMNKTDNKPTYYKELPYDKTDSTPTYYKELPYDKVPVFVAKSVYKFFSPKTEMD